MIFSTLLLPELSVMVARAEGDRISHQMERLLPYWLLGTSILFTLIVLAAPVGLSFVFGASYRGAAPVLALLMVASCALALYNVCSPLVTAYGATWTLTGVTFVSMAVNVALDLLLIPRFGIKGSAVATILAYSVSAVLALTVVQRRVHGRLFRLGAFGAPVLVACVCFMLMDGSAFYVAALGLSAATVAVSVYAFRLFRADDVALLRSLFRGLQFSMLGALRRGKSL